MRFLVTCGPTYENLDQVRRLTNFSTGKLGIGLANDLHEAGHEVTLLKGYYATCSNPCAVSHLPFTTSDDLLNRIHESARVQHDAVFHMAAVADFKFGAVYRRAADNSLEPLASGKFGTRDGKLLAELVPTTKLIGHLRGLFPAAKLFGWKYEVDGTREQVVEVGRRQIRENRTDYCVANGASYGSGYGVIAVAEPLIHCHTPEALFNVLLQLAIA
jgi:phosphopantothenoylcysteine decarboxylase/phosphopantothenate--cysteine ligase